MPLEYCESLKRPAEFGSLFSLIESLKLMSEETQEALESVKACPAPCGDGIVSVTLKRGETRHVPCPLISPECPHGVNLAKELECYLAGVMLEYGVPCRHIGNFAGHVETSVLKDAAKWTLNGFLTFCGRPGSGKSFGAAWSVKKYLVSRIRGRLDRTMWSSAKTAAQGMMWRSANEISSDRETASRAKSISLLVMDDLGNEGDVQVGRAVLRDNVSRRYDAKLPTIITTGLTISDMAECYGTFLTGKLTENDGSMIVDCGGVSVRALGRRAL